MHKTTARRCDGFSPTHCSGNKSLFGRQMWIEFGRIQLPPGHHPNDVEKEWGKLIVAMLEREKSLRPEVERYVQPLSVLILCPAWLDIKGFNV